MDKKTLMKDVFYQMKSLLDIRDYGAVKKLMLEYCNKEDVDYGELKAILIITKSFKDHDIIKDTRKKVLDLIESKYGKQA